MLVASFECRHHSCRTGNAALLYVELKTRQLNANSHLVAQVAAPQGLLDNLIQQHDLSYDASQDFGPQVRDIPLKRRNNVRQTFTRRHQNEARDGCQLIATLGGHAGGITGIVVAPDHCFFVTASSDKTIKVWDAARLERNITGKPRQVYGHHKARVTALCMLEKLHCFASAAENGTIHIVRVPITHGTSTPKYGKLQTIREHQLTHPGEYATCLLHYQTGESFTPADPQIDFISTSTREQFLLNIRNDSWKCFYP
jgi:phosphoinositide-3-kinase regulatory subunit 4